MLCQYFLTLAKTVNKCVYNTHSPANISILYINRQSAIGEECGQNQNIVIKIKYSPDTH